MPSRGVSLNRGPIIFQGFFLIFLNLRAAILKERLLVAASAASVDISLMLFYLWEKR